MFEETVAKDVAFGPKNLGLDAGETERRVREACAGVGLDYAALADRSIYELSGGQMRRAAIAGVLAMEPRVLVLDEPAAGLDPRGREDILGMIKKLHDERKITVIMVSHRMEDVARMVDRIIVMNRGRVAMDGSPEEIFARGEELREMGLNAPESVLLADALRERGFPIPPGIYMPEQILDAAVQIFGGGSKC